MNCVAGSSSKMKCLNISLIMTATPAAGIQLTFHSIAIKCFHQIPFQGLSRWFSHKTTWRMAANGNHREWIWDAHISPVMRAVGWFFNELVPAKSLTAVGVESKGGETSLHPVSPQEISRDLSPAGPACLSFLTTPGWNPGKWCHIHCSEVCPCLAWWAKALKACIYRGSNKNNHRNALEVIRQEKGWKYNCRLHTFILAHESDCSAMLKQGEMQMHFCSSFTPTFLLKLCGPAACLQ